MTRSRSMTALAGAAVIPLTALAVVAGSSATASTPQQTTSAPASHAASTATIRVRTTRLGKILVNSQGHTLYLFKRDSGTKSACFGMCAQFWPPLRVSGKPTVGSGVHASLVSTIKRSDGKRQVTYNHHPLYTFVMDKRAGQTNGEGLTAFGGKWFAVSPSGKQVPVKPSNSSSSPSTGSPSYRAPAPAAP